MQGIYNTLKALRDGTKPEDLKGIASASLMKQLTRGADYDRYAQVFPRRLNSRLQASGWNVTPS